MAAYGPLALKLAGEVADGFVLQLADLDIAEWMIATVRAAAEARPAGTPTPSPSASPHPRTSPTAARPPSRTPASRPGGSAAWSATTSRTSWRSTARAARSRRRSPTTSRAASRYDYNEHGRAGNTHTAFVPDEIVDRFCVLGPAADHIERLQRLKALGVDQFARYLQHDDKEETLRRYGETIIPALRDPVLAAS